MKNETSSHGDRRTFLRAAGLASAGCIAGLGPGAAAQTDPSVESERYRRGFELLRDVGGVGFDGPLNTMAAVSPAFARFVVEYPYGDVLARPNLDLVTRQALTVAALIAQGNHAFPLRFHVNGFLNVGGTPEALVELCILAIGVCGFPAAIDTTGVLKEVFAERGIAARPVPAGEGDGSERHRDGIRHRALHGEDGLRRLRELSERSADYARLLVEFVHGEVLTRGGLDEKTRHLSAVSMLAATGNNRQWMRDHALSALRSGADRDDLIESMIQLSVYAGFPAALVGLSTLVEVFEDLDADRVALVPSEQPVAVTPSETASARFERGSQTLSATSSDAGQQVVARFEGIAPEIGRMIVEHAYGDIFSRPGLGKRERALTAVASMVSAGSLPSETPVRVHVTAALNAGASADDVIETLLNLIPFVGYPKVERALALAGDVFDERDGI